MYPRFPGIGYLSLLMYPHCGLYIWMYPHCLDNRFLGKLMYPHCLLYYISTLPVYRIISTLSGLQEKCLFFFVCFFFFCFFLFCFFFFFFVFFCLGGNTGGIRVILKQFCNGPKCPFTAVIDFPQCASNFAHGTKTTRQQQIYTRWLLQP